MTETANSSGVNQDILVDVNIACYNHEKFIAQTLESVLKQKTNFKFRILIGDDCSTDKSADIIRRYEAKHPDIIKAFYHPKNRGIFNKEESNGLFLIRQSSAPYIAFLDGDDYWTDELKLQKQTDLIKKDSGMSMVGHNVHSLKSSTGEMSIRFSDSDRPADKVYIEDMLVKNWASTPSVLIRTEILKSTPQWIYSEKAVDFFIWCNAISKGHMGYIHEPMAVYRVNDHGAWSKLSLKDRIFLEAHNLIKAAETFSKDKTTGKKRVEDLQLYLINNLKRNRLPQEAAAVARKLITKAILSLNFSYAKRVRQGLKEQVEINLY